VARKEWDVDYAGSGPWRWMERVFTMTLSCVAMEKIKK
jgi:hypothetical protein